MGNKRKNTLTLFLGDLTSEIIFSPQFGAEKRMRQTGRIDSYFWPFRSYKPHLEREYSQLL